MIPTVMMIGGVKSSYLQVILATKNVCPTEKQTDIFLTKFFT